MNDEKENASGGVRWTVTDIGEVKERRFSGTDIGWTVDRDEDGLPLAGAFYKNEWEADTLDLALGVVPDLAEAIARARQRGELIEIVIRPLSSDNIGA